MEDHECVNTLHKGHAGDHSNFCDFTHGDKIASKMADCETIWFSSPEFTKRVNVGYNLNLIHKAIVIRRRRGLRPIVAPAGSTLSTDSHAGHQVPFKGPGHRSTHLQHHVCWVHYCNTV